MSSNPQPHVRFDTTAVSFNGAPAIHDVTANIQRGEFIAVVGPSGCGKSTLLRLTAGLLTASAGTVRLDANAGTKVGFVFQQPTLLPWRRVLDNIALPLELAGVSQAERRTAADEARKLVRLADSDVMKLPRMLSGGMQMRVSIARALVTRPDIMLLDEPFSALDDLIRGALNEELHQLWAQQNWTTIFVTHNVAEAILLSQRVLVMTPGPGTVFEIIPVDLPMPRSLNLRSTSAYAELVGKLATSLRNAADHAGVSA